MYFKVNGPIGTILGRSNCVVTGTSSLGDASCTQHVQLTVSIRNSCCSSRLRFAVGCISWACGVGWVNSPKLVVPTLYGNAKNLILSTNNSQRTRVF